LDDEGELSMPSSASSVLAGLWGNQKTFFCTFF
jgi:hypothetical protein